MLTGRYYSLIFLHPKKGIIIDGHTRYAICLKLGITPKYKIKSFKGEKDEKLYARIVNLKRRHLTPMQRYELVEDEIEDIKKEVKAEGVKFKKENEGKLVDHNKRRKHQSAGRVGSMIDLSANSVEKLKAIKKHGSKSTINKVRRGKLNIGEGYAKVREERRERKDTKFIKRSSALVGISSRKKMTNLHNSKIGVAINILECLHGGETSVTALSLLVSNNYDKISLITKKFIKQKYLSQRIEGKGNFLNITPKGKQLYKSLSKIENICKEHGMTDWL